MSDTPLPQIRMLRPNLANLPPMPEMPEGYTLRKASAEDARRIATLMNTAFECGDWTEERVLRELINHPGCKATFVVVYGEDAAATATLLLEPDNNPGAGVLHWVASDKKHRGKHLGLIVSLSVLYEARLQNCDRSLLLTDDARIPAIKTYLKLGYEPDCWHESHSDRWQSIRDALK